MALLLIYKYYLYIITNYFSRISIWSKYLCVSSIDAKNITRVAFCSGKVYYDLIERREKEGVNDITFIRLEQLYPFIGIVL